MLDPTGINAVTTATYDAFGRMVRSVDANGNAREQVFDRLGRVVTTRDPLGGTRGSSYDAFGRVLTQTDALGQATTYSYDKATLSFTVTTPEGVVTRTTHTRNGQVRSVIDGNGRTTTYSYDRNGNLVQTDTGLTSSVNAYDAASRLIESTDPNGNRVALTYDAANRLLTRTVDPTGLALRTSYQYDAKGQQVAVTDANGVVTTIDYDRNGQVLRQTVDPTGLNLQTVYTYDKGGRTLSVTTPAGTLTQYTYDALGRRVLERVDPSGLNLQRSWSYDRNGNVRTSTDGLGNLTRHVYDAADRLLYTVDPAGGVRQNAYDAEGRLVRSVGYAKPVVLTSLPALATANDVQSLLESRPGQDAVENRVYDRDGRLAASVDGIGAVVRFTYDGNGNVVSRVAYATPINLAAWTPGTVPVPVADALRDARTVTTYDSLNRAILTMDGTGAVVQRDYDGNGNVIREVAYANAVAAGGAAASVVGSANDRITSMAYDNANRLVLQVDALNAVTELAYDGNGNVVKRIAYANPIASVPTLGAPGTAAAIRRALQANAAQDRTLRYGYDAAGRQALAIDATGAAVETLYDKDGRAIASTAYAKLVNTGALPATPTLADLRAQLSATATADRTTRQAYDAAGRLVYSVDALWQVSATQYDAAGQVVRSTHYARVIASDTANAASAIGTAVLADPARDHGDAFTYDAAGRVILAIDALGAAERYSYDALGNKLTFMNKKGHVWTYAYDAAGRQVTETSPQVTLTSVDGTGATLTTLAPESASVITRLAYDALGRLTARTEAVGRREERTTAYDYDAAGHQVKVTFPSVRVYDAANDAITVNGATSVAVRQEMSLLALWTATYYDALGNAVAGRDTAGASSMKAYDRAGRVVYDVDAAGYVTGYQRNTFGEVTTVVRYAGETTLSRVPVSQASQAATRAQIDSVVAGLDPSLNRIVSTTYDRAGRAVEVKEPDAYVSALDASGVHVTGRASKTGTTSYNAFGEAVQESALAGIGGSWATTTHYYDQAGRRRTSVDAMGYVTRWAYDEFGNLSSQTEFATALAAGTWSVASDLGPTPSPADGRTVLFGYDALNRKTSETLASLDYVLLPDVTTQLRGVTTRYGYDAVGNQTCVTDADGNSTYTYYDALGRVSRIAAPSRNSGRDGATLIPLTEFRRDAFGNAIAQTDYQNGALAASAEGCTAGAAAEGDRVTLSFYDALGHVIETRGPGGARQYFSYDFNGRLAKQWQGVADVDNNVRTVFDVRIYDRLGRLLETRTPASTNVLSSDGLRIDTVTQAQAGYVSTAMRYNAFGEMTSKATGGGNQESYQYDKAGRLWRFVGADGVAHIQLFDARGNVTADIQNSGAGGNSVDIMGLVAAESADDNSFRRTDMRYDALGHVDMRLSPSRLDEQGGIGAMRQYATATLLETTIPTFFPGGGTIKSINGRNRVALGWNSLKPLGAGEVKVAIEYRTRLVGDTRVQSVVLEGDLAATGATLSWPDPLDEDYGIAAVTRIVLYKRDVTGSWRVVMDQAPGYGANEIQVTAPPDPTTWVTLEMRSAASTNEADWAAVPIIAFGTSYRFDARSLASGNYAYRVRTAQAGATSVRVVASGAISVGQNIQFASVAQNGERLWPRPTVYQKSDRWGNVTEITDPRAAGWKTTYRYNARNQLIRQEQPDAAGLMNGTGPVTEIFYDRLGRQVGLKDGNQHVSTQAYDAGGNLIREYRPDNLGVVAYEFDAFGQKVRMWDGENHAVNFAYDKAGNLVSTAKGMATIYRADQDGMKREVATQDITDSWTYDELGRKLTQTNGNGEQVRYGYDLRGNVAWTKLPLTPAARVAYDAENRKVAEIDANGLKVSTWTYDWRGLLVAHKDIGGNVYAYSYDSARQLVAQSNNIGQSITYAYDAAGQVTTIYDAYNKKTSTYAYDEAGRKVRETVTQLDPDSSLTRTYQDNHLSYDALGNLRDVADERVHMVIEYDKVGNRTRVISSYNYQDSDGSYGTDRYYRYDAMNRQTVADAVDAAGNLGQTGHRITYDRNSNRMSDTFFGNRVHAVAGQPTVIGFRSDDTAIYGDTPINWVADTGETTESYRYDVLNRLTSVVRDGVQIDVRFYDGADRLVQTGPAAPLPVAYSDLLNQSVPAGDVNGKEVRSYLYDANGRLLHQRVLKSDFTAKAELWWDTNRTITGGNKAFTPDGYDNAGNVRGYVVENFEAGQVNEYTIALKEFDSYQVGTTAATSSVLQPGTTTQQYDANGFLTRIDDATAPASSRKFVNDASGHALFVDQGGKIQRQLVVNGEVLGIYGAAPQSAGTNPSFANLADFDFSYARITSSYPNPSPGAYQVRTGDTLQSIAQGAYGDSALWYRIAEANGLASSSDLKVGQTLNVPNRVSTIHNNTSTFKPYDPSRIEGDKSPNMAMPKHDKGCGGVGKVLMVVVAVLVTAFVGPSLLAAVLSSLASQAVGLATGAIDRFSWKSVAMSVISQGVSSGMSGAFQGLGNLAPVAQAAVGNVVTQGIAVATGLQRKFDWRGVAASAVGAGVGQAVGPALAKAFDDSSVGVFASRMATSLVSGSAAALLHGGRHVVQQVAIDAFGNALGSSIVDAVTPRESVYSLGGGDTSQGLKPASGGGYGLSYSGLRAGAALNDLSTYPSGLTSDMDQSTVMSLREDLGLPSPMPDVHWQLAGGPAAGRSFGGYGSGLPPRLSPMTTEDFRRKEIDQMNAGTVSSAIGPAQSGLTNMWAAAKAYVKRDDVTFGQAVSTAWSDGGKDLFSGIAHTLGAFAAANLAVGSSPTLAGAIGFSALAVQQSDAAATDYVRFFGSGEARGEESFLAQGLAPVIGSDATDFVTAGIDFVGGVGLTASMMRGTWSVASADRRLGLHWEGVMGPNDGPQLPSWPRPVNYGTPAETATVLDTWAGKVRFDASELTEEQVKIATTKAIRRNLGLRTTADGQLIANVDQTQAVLQMLTTWRRGVYAQDPDFLALDPNMQGTIIHGSVANRMRHLNIADVRINQRLYGSSPYISPATGAPYEFRIPDYYHVHGNAILDIKPAGTPLSGPQYQDFRAFARTNDVRWIYYQGFR